MKAAIENYKGIEFVRISALPEEHQKMIWTSAYKHKTIKILRDKELLNDCLPYATYVEWYKETHKTETIVPVKPAERAKELRLAFK